VTDANLAAARLAALLDAERENTALRAEVAHLRGERAATVAFLRKQVGRWEQGKAGWSALDHAAATIEKGFHRREEPPETPA